MKEKESINDKFQIKTPMPFNFELKITSFRSVFKNKICQNANKII